MSFLRRNITCLACAKPVRTGSSRQKNSIFVQPGGASPPKEISMDVIRHGVEEFTELKIREEPYVKALELRVKYLEARIKQLSEELEDMSGTYCPYCEGECRVRDGDIHNADKYYNDYCS